MAPLPGGVGRNPAEAARHAVDVRVDREGRKAAGEQQDAAGGLLPDPPERRQVTTRLARLETPEESEVEPAALGAQPSQGLENGPALGARQPRRPDHPLDRPPPGRQRGVPAGKVPFQDGEGGMTVSIGGVLGQDGQDELIQGGKPSDEPGAAVRRPQAVGGAAERGTAERGAAKRGVAERGGRRPRLARGPSSHRAPGAGWRVNCPSVITTSSGEPGRPSAPGLVSV